MNNAHYNIKRRDFVSYLYKNRDYNTLRNYNSLVQLF